MRRLICTTLLCGMFPGWGLCALLCSALASHQPACCVEVAAAHSCCSEKQSSASSSVSCACTHDAAPIQPVSAPALPALDIPSIPQIELSVGNTFCIIQTPILTPISTRALLAFHKRLNL